MTSRPRDVARPKTREAVTSSPTKISYSVRLTTDEADASDDLVRDMRRALGRRAIEKSDVIRALLGLAQDDETVRAALIAALQPDSK